ncbi:hypothetical protein GGF46_003282 [Coemansia sp. RSA 552]|nr:hypothetical protein GGF46_003282 [Coemansia sp. RSA 552]
MANAQRSSANTLDREPMDPVYCELADTYDWVADVLSLYRVGGWKQKLVELAEPRPGDKIIDVAGGTCQVAERFLTYQDTVNNDKTSTIHVVDFNKDMLRVGRHRLSHHPWEEDGRLTFAQGDAQNLVDVPDNAYDLYSVGYGMHNFPDPEKALREAYRVLKPGGRFACLEFGQVDVPILGLFTNLYRRYGYGAIAHVLTGNGEPYRRMAVSTVNFTHQREFAKMIRNAGFQFAGKGYEEYGFGVSVCYIAFKPE